MCDLYPGCGAFAQFYAVNAQFENRLDITQEGLFIALPIRPVACLIARAFDAYDMTRARHSSAI